MLTNFDELKDWKDSARRGIEYEIERLRDRELRMNDYIRALDATDEMLSEIDSLNEMLEKKQAEADSLNEMLEKKQAEADSLRLQLKEEKEQRQALELRLSELGKLSAGVAKKSSQDELLKALRIFINKSKHKKIEKRTAVKEMVLELANANSIVFPADLAATLDSLDDEQAEPKMVNVMGSYNDIHDNGCVELNDKLL